MNFQKYEEIISKSVEVLREGGVLVFPTDTVWGIGAFIESSRGIRRLYEIKKREESKPTAVLVCDIAMAQKYGVFNSQAKKLADNYWPGGVTIVVEARKGEASGMVCGSRGAIGLRAPDHPLALEILRQLKGGIAASSANFMGEKPAKDFQEIDKGLLERADLIIKPSADEVDPWYQAGRQEPSTVVDTTELPHRILRQGQVQIKL